MTSIRLVDTTDDCGDHLRVERSTDYPDHAYLGIGCPTSGERMGIFLPIKALREALDKIEAEA